MHLEPRRLDFAEVLRRTLEDHRSLLETHRLAVQIPSDPIWVEADLTRLVQAIGNLLLNAAKFTPLG